MNTLNRFKKFEKHHAAILLFLFIAGIFLVNILAFTAAYSRVREARISGIAPLNVAPQTPSTISDEEEDTDTGDDEPVFLTGLRPQLEKVIAAQDANMAVYIQDLDTGESLGINETTTFVSASLYKLFASYEIARQIDLGLIEPSDPTGSDAGVISIEECLYRTLSYSDNICGRSLRKRIGADNAPLVAINEAGFIGTSLVNDYPTTSAADVGLFFEQLYEGTIFSPSVIDMLLDPLSAQEINNRIPVGVPDGIKIAHKTADLEGYSHDAGIVYLNGDGSDYILVILTGPWSNGYVDAPATHIAVSSLVYDWFNPSIDGASY